MKAQLFNSSGCLLDSFDLSKDQGCERINSWLETCRDGDKIVIQQVEEEEWDWQNDFNYVGSKHHY